jgi:hypothetical protein
VDNATRSPHPNTTNKTPQVFFMCKPIAGLSFKAILVFTISLSIVSTYFRTTHIMNVHAYRKGLEFGFTEIAFDQYGWFLRPQFLYVEELIFGNEKRYGEHSTLKVGKGIGNIWTNALSYSFGIAGGGCGLSVYGRQFKSREAAVDAAILELKTMMTAKVGDSDRSNYNPQVIRGTLNAIAKYEVESVQLTLF